MNKDYQKPEVELITLTAMETITTGDGPIDGDVDVSRAPAEW